MKKMLAVILCLSLLCSACGVSYQAAWPMYDTVDELISIADEIFEGTVVAIHFDIVDSRTGKSADGPSNDSSLCLYTVYEIEVNHSYKGTGSVTKYLGVMGGIPGYNESEQLSKMRACGMNSPGIPVMVESKTLEIDSEYLFVLRDFGGDYLEIPNPDQFAFVNTNDTDSQSTSYPNYQNILDSFV